MIEALFSAKMRPIQGRNRMAGNIGIFWVDREPLITAVLPLADGLDDERCLNGPHDDDPMESRCDAPTRVCGASMRRSIRSRTLPPSAA